MSTTNNRTWPAALGQSVTLVNYTHDAKHNAIINWFFNGTANIPETFFKYRYVKLYENFTWSGFSNVASHTLIRSTEGVDHLIQEHLTSEKAAAKKSEYGPVLSAIKGLFLLTGLSEKRIDDALGPLAGASLNAGKPSMETPIPPPERATFMDPALGAPYNTEKYTAADIVPGFKFKEPKNPSVFTVKTVENKWLTYSHPIMPEITKVSISWLLKELNSGWLVEVKPEPKKVYTAADIVPGFRYKPENHKKWYTVEAVDPQGIVYFSHPNIMGTHSRRCGHLLEQLNSGSYIGERVKPDSKKVYTAADITRGFVFKRLENPSVSFAVESVDDNWLLYSHPRLSGITSASVDWLLEELNAGRIVKVKPETKKVYTAADLVPGFQYKIRSMQYPFTVVQFLTEASLVTHPDISGTEMVKDADLLEKLNNGTFIEDKTLVNNLAGRTTERSADKITAQYVPVIEHRLPGTVSIVSIKSVDNNAEIKSGLAVYFNRNWRCHPVRDVFILDRGVHHMD